MGTPGGSTRSTRRVSTPLSPLPLAGAALHTDRLETLSPEGSATSQKVGGACCIWSKRCLRIREACAHLHPWRALAGNKFMRTGRDEKKSVFVGSRLQSCPCCCASAVACSPVVCKRRPTPLADVFGATVKAPQTELSRLASNSTSVNC